MAIASSDTPRSSARRRDRQAGARRCASPEGPISRGVDIETALQRMQTGLYFRLDRSRWRRVKPRNGAGNASFTGWAAGWAMRLSLLPLLLPLLAPAGCAEPTGVFAAANAASVAVFQRAIPDLAVSAATGKDCSVVRLEQGKPYCRPLELLPERPPYCTRSLGTVDCWTDPQKLPGPPPEVADGPTTLTPEQEANRTRRWLDF